MEAFTTGITRRLVQGLGALMQQLQRQQRRPQLLQQPRPQQQSIQGGGTARLRADRPLTVIAAHRVGKLAPATVLQAVEGHTLPADSYDCYAVISSCSVFLVRDLVV